VIDAWISSPEEARLAANAAPTFAFGNADANARTAAAPTNMWAAALRLVRALRPTRSSAMRVASTYNSFLFYACAVKPSFVEVAGFEPA